MKAYLYLYYILLLFILILPVGCVSSGMPDLPNEPTFRKPSSSAKTYKPPGEWLIRSEKDLEPLKKLGAQVTKVNGVLIVDLKGMIIDGSKQKGTGDQTETQTSLFKAQTPLVVKNGFFKNTKNAAAFYKPNSGVKNITCYDVGEDAVSTHDGAFNFSVENCEFRDAADKNLQCNEAKGARIINNTFYGGRTGARVGKISHSSNSDLAICSGNKFLGCDIAWGVGKITLEVRGKKNSYTNVNHPFRLDGGASVKNADGDIKNDN